jgi:hypothetical protein
MQALMSRPALRGASLVTDATGVGVAVLDLLRDANLDPIPITITAGDRATYEGGHHRVPKRDLVAVVQVLLQTERLTIAAALPEAEVLVQELLGFEVRITSAGNDSFGAWREGMHDDLVLAVALACWLGENEPRCWIVVG